MLLTELLIIYLACGAPFGVYKISKCDLPRSIHGVAVTVAHIALWPIFVTALIQNWMSQPRAIAETDLDTEVRAIRARIESLAFSERSPTAVFEFREVFNRYTGLTMALNFSENSQPQHPLFEVEGRRDTRIASACIDRRNRQRLSFHQVQARNDLVDMISLLAISFPSGPKIISLGLVLGDLLDDPETVNDLKMYLPEDQQARSAVARRSPMSTDLKVSASSHSQIN